MTTKTRQSKTAGTKTKAKVTTNRTSRREKKPAGGKTQRQRVEEEIADRIIELLDQGELPPGRKGWRDSQSGVPVNAISMKPYRGINRWMTLITQKAMGYDEPRWLTYRQAEALGGHVRKDEKSTIIIFWKRVPFREREEGEEGEERENEEHGNNGTPPDVSRTRTYPILRSYRVFNLEQTQDCQVKPLPTPEVTDHDPIQAAEAIIAGMPGPPGIEFYENANYVPHYQPAGDVIRVPKMGRYPNPEDYYNTVFHELTHATGHPKRLERFSLDANANDLHAYGREELTAAMGSAMLAAHAGISAELVERDASYIRHWRDAISADKPMIIRSATLAQRAVDLILGEKPPRVPAGQAGTKPGRRPIQRGLIQRGLIHRRRAGRKTRRPKIKCPSHPNSSRPNWKPRRMGATRNSWKATTGKPTCRRLPRDGSCGPPTIAPAAGRQSTSCSAGKKRPSWPPASRSRARSQANSPPGCSSWNTAGWNPKPPKPAARLSGSSTPAPARPGPSRKPGRPTPVGREAPAPGSRAVPRLQGHPQAAPVETTAGRRPRRRISPRVRRLPRPDARPPGQTGPHRPGPGTAARRKGVPLPGRRERRHPRHRRRVLRTRTPAPHPGTTGRTGETGKPGSAAGTGPRAPSPPEIQNAEGVGKCLKS